ncbi:hypothetical protein [uncultured Jatrophihabitans sp.]|uniref:hypothetical protein n=1 Tax=uncultured Jatrophihabitans sp. TaxID=1610747 RepID=UPI0035CB77D4
MTNTCPCGSTSFTGDEGPVRDLPGGLGTVVRWRCDGCNTVHYDDDALARLRAALAGARTALAAVKEAGWRRPTGPSAA